MPDGVESRSRRIVRGEIDASDKTTSLLLPSRGGGPWPPFERFAETMTTSRTKFRRHPHQAEEVVIYLLDGEIEHVDGSGRRETMTRGSTAVITAHREITHELETLRGKRARWLSIVIRLAPRENPPPTTIRIEAPGDVTEATDGTVHRPVVGPLARSKTTSGLELLDIEFPKGGTGFFRIGRDRKAVAYAVNGSGTIDTAPIDPGSGVLLENMSGLAIGGSPGYRVVLATVPVSSKAEPDAATSSARSA